ncbi:MAG: hypothetical protein HN704_08110 [Bacteroidetes bacterium]|jgi:hypothetical protein|nr:hypothetical protein [Bacteroidota bacterium]MBT6686487.1 hypothetical protein [Bacteroidota bacterium]MBT7143339.1 hypothetical protein [Bacteroidota bacterium]MBT7491555.1 hypothetical protein [Bacteroidota bacterium]
MPKFIGIFSKEDNIKTQLIDVSENLNYIENIGYDKLCIRANLNDNKIFFWGNIFNTAELKKLLQIEDNNVAKIVLSLYLKKKTMD